MFGSGETLWHAIYIDDLVDGILLCGEHPQALNQTYILVGERYLTLNRLVQEIEGDRRTAAQRQIAILAFGDSGRCLRSVMPCTAPRAALAPTASRLFVNDGAFSIERARRELGFAPKVS